MKRICLIVVLSLTVLTANAADTPEDIFWKSVRKTDAVEEYRLYLEQYPKGRYIGEAWRRIGAIEALDAQRTRSAEEAKPQSQAKPIAERYRDNRDGTVTGVGTDNVLAATPNWRNIALWRKLNKNMSQAQVQAILGPPTTIDSGRVITTWHYGYPTGGQVAFFTETNIVYGWWEP